MHFIEGLIPLFAAHDSKMFIEQGAMKSLDKAVALRTGDLGFSMIDGLQLENEFIGVSVWAATVFASVITENGFDLNGMFFIKRIL